MSVRRIAGCTCGSGAHPRECRLHPESFRIHCAALSLEAHLDDSSEAQAAIHEYDQAFEAWRVARTEAARSAVRMVLGLLSELRLACGRALDATEIEQARLILAAGLADVDHKLLQQADSDGNVVFDL